MTLLKDCVRELLDALISECTAKAEMQPLARTFVFYVVAFAISTILLLTANTALLAALVNKIK